VIKAFIKPKGPLPVKDFVDSIAREAFDAVKYGRKIRVVQNSKNDMHMIRHHHSRVQVYSPSIPMQESRQCGSSGFWGHSQ